MKSNFMNPQRKRAVSGFTLVELLVVIAIIGIFVSLMMPAIQQSRESARRVQCDKNIGQLSAAAMEFELASGSFPSGTTIAVAESGEAAAPGPIQNVADSGVLHHSWIVQLLPYLDEPAAAERIDPNVSVYDERHQEVRELELSALRCASSGAEVNAASPGTNYAGVHHDMNGPIDQSNMGILYLNSHTTRSEIKDGLQYTMLLGEKSLEKDTLGWMSGTRATLRNTGDPFDDGSAAAAADAKAAADPLFVGGFGSRHPGGVLFAFANGSTSFLEYGMDPKIYQQLAHRADGELMNLMEVK